MLTFHVLLWTKWLNLLSQQTCLKLSNYQKSNSVCKGIETPQVLDQPIPLCSSFKILLALWSTIMLPSTQFKQAFLLQSRYTQSSTTIRMLILKCPSLWTSPPFTQSLQEETLSLHTLSRSFLWMLLLQLYPVWLILLWIQAVFSTQLRDKFEYQMQSTKQFQADRECQ